MYTLNPDKIKIGYVILAAVPKPLVSKVQRRAGYGESSKWTHVAGSLGGLDAVEAVMPRSRVINLQKRYVERGIEIKVMRRRGQPEQKRYKVDLQFAWFPLAVACGTVGLFRMSCRRILMMRSCLRRWESGDPGNLGDWGLGKREFGELSA